MIGEVLFNIKKFLEDHDADQTVMEDWEALRCWITEMIDSVMQLSEDGK